MTNPDNYYLELNSYNRSEGANWEYDMMILNRKIKIIYAKNKLILGGN